MIKYLLILPLLVSISLAENVNDVQPIDGESLNRLISVIGSSGGGASTNSPNQAWSGTNAFNNRTIFNGTVLFTNRAVFGSIATTVSNIDVRGGTWFVANNFDSSGRRFIYDNGFDAITYDGASNNGLLNYYDGSASVDFLNGALMFNSTLVFNYNGSQPTFGGNNEFTWNQSFRMIPGKTATINGTLFSSNANTVALSIRGNAGQNFSVTNVFAGTTNVLVYGSGVVTNFFKVP